MSNSLVVFISGSINSGKSTVGALLSSKLDAPFIEFDDIRDSEYGELELNEAIDKVIDRGVEIINELVARHGRVVAAYPLTRRQMSLIERNIHARVLFVTLAPPLQVALAKRGQRKLSTKERERIAYQYQTVEIHKPRRGVTIDNSEMSAQQVAGEIAAQIMNY